MINETKRPKGFQPGRSKTGGIQKGQVQQKTKDWILIGEIFKGEFTERAIEIMNNSDDETFMRHYKDLLEYFKPRMSRVEVSEQAPYIIDLSGLTDEQLSKLAGEAGSDY